MTSSPASRVDQASADSAASPDVSEDSSAAITLCELIADAGPLPIDAALECFQRVAERLDDDPGQAESPLGPSQILIDDNGDVWLGSPSSNGRSDVGAEHPSRRVLDELAYLLTYLTNAADDDPQSHQQGSRPSCPQSVSALGARLSSREEDVYASYAAIAADVAKVRSGMEIVREPLIEHQPADNFKSPDEASAVYEPAADNRDDSRTPATSTTVPAAEADDERSEPHPVEIAAATAGGTRWLVAGGLALVAMAVLLWLMAM